MTHNDKRRQQEHPIWLLKSVPLKERARIVWSITKGHLARAPLRLRTYFERHTFLPMLTAIALGVGATGAVILLYGWRCWGHNTADCTAIRASIPWTFLTALVAAPAAILTWYWRTDHKKRDIELARSEELMSRFAKAVELLQSGAPGAIYALESIGRDSARDHAAVMETLAAFVRANSLPIQIASGLQKEQFVRVQAAITVLGRRDTNQDPLGYFIDLSDTNLTDVDFSGLNFAGARFDRAVLSRAIFCCAELHGASFLAVSAQFAQYDLTTAMDDRVRAQLQKAGAIDDDPEKRLALEHFGRDIKLQLEDPNAP